MSSTITNLSPAGSPSRAPKRTSWRVPAGVLLLSAVPIAAGVKRLIELASGAAVTDQNRRFFDSPVPLVVHVVGVVVFCLAGAVQFAPSARRRSPRWHRLAGRAVAPAGLAVAASGLWMTHRYRLPVSDNALLGMFRDVAGVWMLVTIAVGLGAVRQRRFRRHGAWMARAMAVGLGAGTQVFTHLPWIAAFGEPSPAARAWLMFAGWAFNVAFVEYVLRRRAGDNGRSPRRTDPRPTGLEGAHV